MLDLLTFPWVGFHAARRNLLVTTDGASATHKLLTWLDGLNRPASPDTGHPGMRVQYSVGWRCDKRTGPAIIYRLPETAWTAPPPPRPGSLDAESGPNTLGEVAEAHRPARPVRLAERVAHGILLPRPWGVAFDGPLASVVWERRKMAARKAVEDFVYQPDGPQEILPLPFARCGDPYRDADWHWMATFADLHPRIQAVTEPDIRWRTSRTDHRRLQQLAPVISSQVSAAISAGSRRRPHSPRRI